MADVKISNLPPIVTPNGADVLPIVDVDAGPAVTNKIQLTQLNTFFLDKGVTTLVYAASVDLDFSPTLPPTKYLVLTGDVTLTTSNLGPGRGVQLRMEAGASDRALTFPGGWKFLGGPAPTTLPTNKIGILSLSSFGVADADVVADFSFDTTETALRGVGAAGQIGFFTDPDSMGGDTALNWDNVNKRLGIGTANPATTLEVVTGQFLTRYGSAPPHFQFRGATGTEGAPGVVASGNPAGLLTFSAYNGSAFVEGSRILSRVTETWNGTSRGSCLVFETIDNTTTIQDERMRIDQNGSVLIGVTSSDSHLHAEGAGVQFRATRTDAGAIAVFQGPNETLASGNANVYIHNNDAFGIDKGGSLGLMAPINATPTLVPMAYLAGRKENATSGNEDGYLSLGVRRDGVGAVERMRIGTEITVTVVDNLANAMLVQEGANAYLDITTTDGSEHIELGNTTTNPVLTQLGSGQVTFNGNVDAVNGLDVTTAALTTGAGITNSGGEVLVSGGNVQLNDNIVLSLGTGDDLTLVHDGTDSTVATATGDLNLNSSAGDVVANSESVERGRRAHKTSDETVTNSVTLIDDAALRVSLRASTNYRIQARIFVDLGAGGIRIGLGTPDTLTITSMKAQVKIWDDATTVAAGRTTALDGVVTHSGAGTGSHYIEIDAVVQANAAGVLSVTWAQDSSNAAATTVQADSVLEAMQL